MASLSRNAVAVGAVAIVATMIMAFSGWFDRAQAPLPRPAGAVEPLPVAPVPAQGEAIPAAAATPAKGSPPLLRLPDGTSVPYLNAVTTPVEFAWEQGRPYAAIIGTTRDQDGLEWYVHADGCWTTTRNVWRDDLGRNDATAVCKAPTSVVTDRQKR
jgi:hypothetical protein